MPIPIKVALDSTPNTFHSGFYVAQAQGRYQARGLDVRLLAADAAGDDFSPAAQLAAGRASFGIVSAERIISAQQSPRGGGLVGIAALTQSDASAIVTLAAGGRARPRDLDGCLYASYGAPFECEIVAELIRADGGRGEFTETHPQRLGIWAALLRGEADAAWIALPWEGLEAELRGLGLHRFPLAAHAVPYCYPVLLAAHPRMLAEAPTLVREFVQASAEGFAEAAREPERAAALLREQAGHPALGDEAFVRRSQQLLARDYLAPGRGWGLMERGRWARFAAWLEARGIVEAPIDVERLFTNAFAE
jgi:ABC-type nitrate/sulfonate/bicarbonate transport system substrate-binding protein